MPNRRMAFPQPFRLFDLPCMAGHGHEVAEVERAIQARKRIVVRHAFDLHDIGLGLLAIGMADPVLQLSVIGKEHQALAVGVKAPGWVDAGNIKIISQGFPAFVRGKLAHDIERFIEKNQGHERQWW